MNKLKTDIDKGLKFVWTDLEFMDTAYRDAFNALLSVYGLSSEVFIISGCDTYNENSNLGINYISYNAGYISYGGEILKVDAAVDVPFTGIGPYWGLSETDDTNYPKTTEQTFQTKYQYQIRKGLLLQRPSLSFTYYKDTKKFWDIVGEKLNINNLIINAPQGNKFRINSGETFTIREDFQFYIKGRPLEVNGLLINNGEIYWDYPIILNN